jgi:uncharacterized protein (TIGR03382 family)
MKPSRILLSFAAGLVAAFSWVSTAEGFVILGTGTAALKGSDLTDPDNNGAPDADTNYNATFTSSEEPGFGGGEFAFNVFDNQVGGGNMKWCCGDLNNFPTNPISISATLGAAQVLTHFTVTSGNDTPTRDPRVWQIQGSNDGVNFTTIYLRNDPAAAIWTARDQVIRFDGGGVDYATPIAYSTFRFITTATGATTGARFQLAEIEYFTGPIPEPGTAFLALGGAGLLGAFRRRRA